MNWPWWRILTHKFTTKTSLNSSDTCFKLIICGHCLRQINTMCTDCCLCKECKLNGKWWKQKHHYLMITSAETAQWKPTLQSELLNDKLTKHHVRCVCMWFWLKLYPHTLSISSPDLLRRFSSVKSPMISPSSPQHMSITKNPLSSKALIWCSVNMGAARYFTLLS